MYASLMSRERLNQDVGWIGITRITQNFQSFSESITEFIRSRDKPLMPEYIKPADSGNNSGKETKYAGKIIHIIFSIAVAFINGVFLWVFWWKLIILNKPNDRVEGRGRKEPEK